MSAVVTDQFRIANATSFVESVLNDVNSYYVFLGLPNPTVAGFGRTTTSSDWPLSPVDNLSYQTHYRDTMMFGKKITSANIRRVVKKHTWVRNNRYDMYRHDYSADNLAPNSKTTNLYRSNYYVINSDFEVYICIDNGSSGLSSSSTAKGNRSLIEPNFTDVEPITLSDGYTWKYLFTIAPSDIIKFDSTEYISLPNSWESSTDSQIAAVRDNANSDVYLNQIKKVYIDRQGENYSGGLGKECDIIGDGTGAKVVVDVVSGKITDATVSSGGSGYSYGLVDLGDINGNVGIGTSAPGTELEVNGDIGIGRVAGGYTFREVVGGGERAGIISNSSNALIFNTGSAVEQMRISGTGDMLIAKNATNVATVGIELRADGLGTFTKSGGIPLIVNRNTNDGTLVSLRQGNTQEGSINVSGGNVSFNQFLGSHWAALTDWSRPEIKIGTILETINELTDWKYAAIEVEGEQKKICYNGTAAPGDTVSVEYEGKIYEGIVELETNPEFNKFVKAKVNDMAASKAVYGVFIGWNTDSDLDGGIWNDMYVGAVGNYVIRMAAGQDPELGDLVESNGTGCGVVQDDDIIRTKTVAKITSTIPQVTYDDGSFLVTCVLYCG